MNVGSFSLSRMATQFTRVSAESVSPFPILGWICTVVAFRMVATLLIISSVSKIFGVVLNSGYYSIVSSLTLPMIFVRSSVEIGDGVLVASGN